MSHQTLESQLAGIRNAVRERLPQLADLVERMAGELEQTNAAKALNVGNAAPDFELSRADNGEPVRLADWLKRGPVVISFYRGQW